MPRSLSTPTDTYTQFFREDNLVVLADLIPKLWDPAELVTMAEVGPSSGEETWTALSVFAVKGLNVFIHAYEANPARIAEARRAVYSIHPNILAFVCEQGGFPPECLDHFVIDRRRNRVEPSDQLRADVGFVERNIFQRPLPAAGAKIVLANNVLFHYGVDERDAFFQGMVDGCEDNGVVAFDPDHWIAEWTESLPDRYPVTPCRDVPKPYQASTLIVNRG